MDIPSPAVLRKLLNYDPDTGILTWKPRSLSAFSSYRIFRSWNSRYANKPAGTAVNGYLNLILNSSTIGAHRIAWAIYYDKWPTDHIDHINGNRADNRILNFRCVTKGQNNRNAKRRADNKSGVTGVHVRETANGVRYYAYIGWNIHLGSFATLGQAAAARKKAEIEHGFHPNHGRH